MISSWAKKLGRFEDAVIRGKEEAKDVVMADAEDGAEMGAEMSVETSAETSAEGGVVWATQVTMQGIVLIDWQKEEEELMALAPPEETTTHERQQTNVEQTNVEQQDAEQQRTERQSVVQENVMEEETRPIELPGKTMVGDEAQQDLKKRGTGSEELKWTPSQQDTYINEPTQSFDGLKEPDQYGSTTPSPSQQQMHGHELTLESHRHRQSSRVSLPSDQESQAACSVSTPNPFAAHPAKPTRQESEALLLHNLYKEHYVESTEQDAVKASLREDPKSNKPAEQQKTPVKLKPIFLYPKKPQKSYPRVFSPTPLKTPGPQRIPEIKPLPSWILEARRKDAVAPPPDTKLKTEDVSPSPDEEHANPAPESPVAQSTSRAQPRSRNVPHRPDTDCAIHSLLSKPAHTTQDKDDQIAELATHVKRLMNERDAAMLENLALRAAANRTRQDNRRLVHNQSMRWVGRPDQTRLRSKLIGLFTR